MKILGSQIGVLLFMFIGAVVIWAIDKVRKEKVDDDEADYIMGWFIGAGFILAFLVYECS